MKKNTIIKLLVVFLILSSITAFSYYSYFKNNYQGIFPTYEFNKENVLILDTLFIKENIVVWFCEDLGVGGYSTGKLALTNDIKNLKSQDVFFVSSYITEIEFIKEKKMLKIQTFKNQYVNSTDSKFLIEKESLSFDVSIVNNGDFRNSKDFRIMNKNYW